MTAIAIIGGVAEGVGSAALIGVKARIVVFGIEVCRHGIDGEQAMHAETRRLAYDGSLR